MDLSNDVFLEDPGNHEGVEGEFVTLSCTYSTGGLARYYAWEFYQRGGNRLTIRSNSSFP